MEELIRLEWSYEPKGYFETPIVIEESDYTLEIDGGKAVASIDPDTYGENEGIRDKISEHLQDLFYGVQVVRHQPFKLSRYTMYQKDTSGKTNVTVFPEPAVLIASGKLDIKQTDSQGNIVVDTQADRIREKRQFAELSLGLTSTLIIA